MASLQLTAIRTVMRGMQAVAPDYTAKKAYEFMGKPRKTKVRDFERAALAKAEKGVHHFKDYSIRTYKWGSGSKKVLLVHGWEGHAGNFAGLVDVLLEMDYSIYSYDAPAHGQSSGSTANIFDYGELAGEMIMKRKYDVLLSHSFGSVAMVMGMYMHKTQASVEKMVMVTSPDRFEDRIDEVLKFVGLNGKTKSRLVKLIEEKKGVNAYDTNVSDWVQELNVGEALLLSDKADKVLPVEWTRRIANKWDKAKMIELDNVGHYRILSSKVAHQHIVNFLA